MVSYTPYRALITEDFGDRMLDAIALETAMRCLTDEEREIIHLWFVEDLTFAEIGVIVGLKYRDRELSGSGVRYLRDQILKKLRVALHE